MKIRVPLATTLAVAMTSGLAINADAALIDRGGGLIYDSDRNITWLQEVSGGIARDNWSAVSAAVDAFSYFDTVRGVTYTDWRLPTALNSDGTGPCSGVDCTDSEMGHIFYTELGNTAGVLPPNVGDFTGVVTDATGSYWTSTVFPDTPTDGHWVFYWGGTTSNVGKQGPLTAAGLGYAWLVRDGDVVPEPTSVALIGSALVGLVGLRRWRQDRSNRD